MKLLTIVILLISCFSYAGIEVGEKFLLPNVTYVNGGATVASGAILNIGQNVLTRTNSGGKTFYLNSFTIEGFFNVVSASATWLGSCSLQIPIGTTVATFNLMNPTNSGVDRVVVNPTWPIVVTNSMGFNCVNKTATTTNWGANYNGWEY